MPTGVWLARELFHGNNSPETSPYFNGLCLRGDTRRINFVSRTKDLWRDIIACDCIPSRSTLSANSAGEVRMRNGNVIRGPWRRNHHARTSASLAPILARASNVTEDSPRSPAKRTRFSQCVDGMPRTRQTLTVDGASDSADATAFVPPRESMTESGVIMDHNVVCGLQTCQGFAKRKTTIGTGCGAIRSMPDSREVIFARLEALREELSALNPAFKVEGKFAAAIGIHKTSWSQIKSYDRDFPVTAAFRIKDQWGFSLDWIYYGEQADAARIMAKIGRGPLTATPPRQKEGTHKRKAS